MNALERLRLADPVPEEDRLLAAPGAMDAFVLSVKERSGPVADMREKPIEVRDQAPVQVPEDVDQPAGPNVRRSTRPWRLAAAAAAAVIVLVAATLAVLNGTNGEPDAAAPAGSDEMGVVLSAYDALNAGDIEGWLGHFSDDAVMFSAENTRLDETRETTRKIYEVQAAANYRADVVEACRLVGPSLAGGRQVECTIRESDDFHGPAGLSLTRRELFTVNDDGKISEVSAQVIAFTQPGYFVYNQAFYDWLRDAHPEVHAEIRPEITTHLPQTPEHVRAALEYLDEFIAQSDLYPVGDGS